MGGPIGALGTGVVWGWAVAGLAPTAVLAGVVAAVSAVMVAVVVVLAGAVAAFSFVLAAAAGGAVHAVWRHRLGRRFGALPAPGQVR